MVNGENKKCCQNKIDLESMGENGTEYKKELKLIHINRLYVKVYKIQHFQLT